MRRTMLVYAGIDEAGYGPLMGPLCVATSQWCISDASDPLAPPDLWKLLQRAVCRSAKDRRGRIAINDSKKLKGTGAAGEHPMRAIERGVLASLTLHPTPPAILATDTELFAHLGVDDPALHAAWYAGSIALPWACDRPRLQIAESMLRSAAKAGAVASHTLACKAVDAESINAAAQRGMVKTSIPWALLIQIVQALSAQWPTTPVRVAADRQSGRMRYLDDLMRAFPDDRLAILHEDPLESIYRLDRAGAPASAPLVISFTVEGECGHLPIALASMTAKYTRELWMARLNRWFSQHVHSLVPTAGYVKDGRRFLQAVRPTLAAQGLAETRLIRAI